MPIFRDKPVRLQPFFGYRSRDRLVLEARALRSRAPRFTRSGPARAMRTMLAQFLSHEVPGLRVVLEAALPDGRILREEQVTNGEGYVRFEIALETGWDQPEHPVWETVRLGWRNSDGRQSVSGHVLVPGTGDELAVISDIDDTIIETGVTGGLRSVIRNWRRLLAQYPDERLAVDGAGTFYGALSGGHVEPEEAQPAGRQIRATHRPFFYISSSPWNLFSYLVAFQRAKGLPLGPLLLRDWGFNRATLGKESHGAHKRAAIDEVLATFPDKRFALIGDDTQGDLPAFAEAVARHPGRIAAVFLRTVAGEPMTEAELAAKGQLRDSQVPLWLGDTFATGRDFLHALGFTPGGETERIVRTVEKAETEDDEA
jgi:phosphatidate phosphatase APP1